jgi:hypothetical protein
MINLSKTPINVTETLQLEPKPIAIDGDGKKCWKIKSRYVDDCEYKIWAMTYTQALELLPLIEDL